MAQKIINTKIQEAYDTEANWIKYNPVLLAGQLAFSKDKYGKYKIGDGIAKWSQLQYMTLGWNDITGKPNTFPPSTHNHSASQITGLPTKLPNPYVLTVKANGYLLNTYDGTAAKEVNITPAVIGAATSGHTHSQYAPTSHNHSADNITSGVLPIGRGGTGGTNLTTAASNLQFESIGTGITNIQNNADLNTYMTPGTYTSPSANNTGIKNRPSGTGGAFKLVVKYALGNNGYIQQIMTGYYSRMEYTRYYNSDNGAWSRWIKTFDESDIIPVTSGGTGANTYSTALKNLVINGAVSGSAVPTDTNWYLCSDIADSSGTPVRRSMSSLWSYIKGKTDPLYQPKGSYAASSHTHNYAGSSSAGGAANSANMLNANAGSSTQPVYFSGGKPVACAYTLGKSVPSNAVFTDTNTWRPVQNNLTSTSTSDALSAYQGKVLKDLIDGKASSNHSHSYLPLSGGTLSGRLTANGRIYATSIGGGWISGMTPTNATLGISTQNLNGSYHPIISCKTYNSHVWNLGTITDTVGFYGFKKGRTDNGTDWAFTIDVTNGAVNSTGNISAPTFYGSLNGNAKTATNVAWSGITGKPSSFTPSSHSHTIANITNLQSALDGKANYTHNHDAAYATRTHAHEHIRDCNNKADIGISSTLGIVPSVSEKYDIVVTNTSEFGNKFVTMDKGSLVDTIANDVNGRITINAISNAQIDSLAKL